MGKQTARRSPSTVHVPRPFPAEAAESGVRSRPGGLVREALRITAIPLVQHLARTRGLPLTVTATELRWAIEELGLQVDAGTLHRILVATQPEDAAADWELRTDGRVYRFARRGRPPDRRRAP